MTPMMQQYFEIKNQYKDYLLFYQYEKETKSYISP